MTRMSALELLDVVVDADSFDSWDSPAFDYSVDILDRFEGQPLSKTTAEIERGASYEFVLNHTVNVGRPDELFRTTISEVVHA